jgi:hypothetical protein
LRHNPSYRNIIVPPGPISIVTPAGDWPVPACGNVPRAHAYTAAVDDRATLTQARSMLILLLATCKQTQIALEAAANALDTDLTSDLGAMIERTEGELASLAEKIQALPE